jgi:hypothetical protein
VFHVKILLIALLSFSAVSVAAFAPQEVQPGQNPADVQIRARQLPPREPATVFNPQKAPGVQLRQVPPAVLQNVRSLYREPTDKELESLQPAEEDRVKYAAFLRQRGTGIVRLVEDSGCGDGTRIISAATPCVQYSMPGNGAFYSFREANYRLSRLADIRFSSGNFGVAGVLRHGILTGIGDIPLEQVRLNSKGIDHLNKFAPAGKFSDAVKMGEELRKGSEKNGYYYAQEVRAVESMTYVIRSVAYRGSVYRSVGGYVYDELDFDKRVDITTAFRIIRKHDDGSITLLWKELDRKQSPVLKREKDPANVDADKFTAKSK